ncbi:MAG: DUF1559 domain-containing protein [Planctomycetota bacterium]
METVATKFFSVLFLTIFGGGWTLPLGLPPAPEDPALARVAPEKCLFYVSWAGMAVPDPKSKNQTEQLLAEPEVQHCFATLATFVSKAALPDPTDTKDRGDAAYLQVALEFAKIAAAHPGAIFATEIKADKDGTPQYVRGGMLVVAGQDSDKLRAAFDQFRQNVKAADVKEVQIAGHAWYRFGHTGSMNIESVTCGFQGTDFILGIGDGSIEEILKRRQQEPPAWLGTLRKQLPVERVSTVVYLNLKMLLDQVATDKTMPKTRNALRRLGLDKLSALSSVSGLEGETFTSKLLLSTDGEPNGPLLSLFSDQPLRAGDLTPIPRDATLSFAMRFDAQKVVDQVTAMIENMEPVQRTGIEQSLDALTKSLQVDLRRDLPKALGDTCCIYSSPSEGGLVLLGLTAVVPIRDRDALSVIQAKFLGSSIAKSFQSAVTKNPLERSPSPAPQLHACSFAGQKIYYFTNTGILPVAWCATDRELIVATVPQNIMAYLQHGPAHKSLATVSQVSRLIEGTDSPSMLVYVDTAKLFELAYPFVPLVASYSTDLFGEEKQLPLGSIPSAPAIGRHMVPSTAALRRTKQGLELISRQPLPGTGLLWTATVAMESPQSLEQQIAAEGQPRNEMPFIGAAATAVPVEVPAPAGEIQPIQPAPATRAATLSPVRTYSSPATTSDPFASRPSAYNTAPLPSAANPIPMPPQTGSAPCYGPPTVGPLPSVPAAPEELQLQEIGFGVKAYRRKLQTMPPAYLADKQGKPLLSWRVALLPYLGQQDLYKRFHLDEPWDSPHNRELIPLMPQVYRDPYDARYVTPAKDLAGKTRFLLVRGPKTFYADPTPPMPRMYEEWVKVIVVVADLERAVPWTKPEEWTYDEKNPLAGLAKENFHAEAMLMACGAISVSYLPDDIKSPTDDRIDRNRLRCLFTGEEATENLPPPYFSPPSR